MEGNASGFKAPRTTSRGTSVKATPILSRELVF
jgi:hypothetical protein